MSDDVRDDQLVVVRIVGMHCHKCEEAIRKSLLSVQGVHEVEVDFPSSQASVLYNPAEARIKQIIDAVSRAGYQPAGFTERFSGPLSNPSADSPTAG